MTKDILDFAYFCLGIKTYLNRRVRSASSIYGGELELVSACLPYSIALDVTLPRDFPGVFAYDVAEPFGEYIAEQVDTGKFDPQLAIAKLTQLIQVA